MASLCFAGRVKRRCVNALSMLQNDLMLQGLASFPLSLGLSKACVKRCSLLITTDSGPRHFAAAFQRPVLSLFGPTHIEWTETYQRLALHMQQEMSCGPCQQRVCPLEHHRCMRDLMPEDVYWQAIRLFPTCETKSTTRETQRMIHPKYREQFASLGFTQASDFLSLTGTVISGHPDRQVSKVSIGNVDALLKIEHRVPWKQRWENALAKDLASSPNQSGRPKLLQQLEATSIHAPQWIVYGRDE